MRWFASVLGAGLLLAASAGVSSGQGYPASVHGWYPPPAYAPNCPVPAMPYGPPPPRMMPVYPAAPAAPAAPSTPATPATPSTPGTTAAPSTAPGASAAPSTGAGAGAAPTSPAGTGDTGAGAAGAAAGAAPAAGDTGPSQTGSGGGGERGSGGTASLAPNMFGDAFNSGAIRAQVRGPVSTRFGGTFTVAGTSNPVAFPISPAQMGFTPTSVVPTFLIPTGNVVTVFGIPINEDYRAAGPRNTSNNRFPLLQNSQDSAASLVQAQATYGPGGVLTYVSDPNFSNARDLGNGFATITVFHDYTQQKEIAVLSVPTPSGGGLVGRTKIADDNNPMPRDRVIFGYDYYSGVNLGYGKNDVNRFSPGYEMTFFNQRTSIEVRVPFASTLNSDLVANGVNSYAVELGNLHFTFKGLLYRSECLNIAGGLGLALPTADDFKVILPNRGPYIQVRNEAVVLTPYLAALWTPTDRFFAQAWYACGFDAGGSTVDANVTGSGLTFVGRLNDGPLSQADLQLGYWLVRCPGPYTLLRGLAGFVELHHNAALSPGNPITSAPLIIAGINGVNELNASAGLIFNLGENVNFSVGAVVPLLQEDRTFDWQAGFRLNIFFGPTLAGRRGEAVSTF